MLHKNPEFKKNIKLEFSVTRIVISSILLLLATWIGWSTGSLSKSWLQLPVEYQRASSMTSFLFGFGFFFSILWGSHLASNSLLNEMRQKTWDFMRMSSIKPQKILFGKLLGATSVIWIITLLGILPLLYIASDYLFIDGGYHRPAAFTVTYLFSSIIFWMILSFSFVMLIGLYTYSKESRHSTISAAFLALIAGLFIGGGISTNYSKEYELQLPCKGQLNAVIISNTNLIGPPRPCEIRNPYPLNDLTYSLSPIELTKWYDFKIFPLDSIAFFLMFAAVWCVIGLYRTLRTSLQYMDAPYVWPIFLIIGAFFLNGFDYGARSQHNYIEHFSILFALSLLPACMKEAGNLVGYRRLFECIKAKNYKEAFKITPLWLISLICFILVAPFVLMNSGDFLVGYNRGQYVTELQTPSPSTAYWFYSSVVLFAIRDMMAVHIIAWRKAIRAPLVGMAAYFVTMYVLTPFIAKAVVGNTARGENYFMPITPSRSHDDGIIDFSHPIIFMLIHITIILIMFIPFKRSLKRILAKE